MPRPITNYSDLENTAQDGVQSSQEIKDKVDDLTSGYIKQHIHNFPRELNGIVSAFFYSPDALPKLFNEPNNLQDESSQAVNNQIQLTRCVVL